nr:RNA-directed DNA polymerase, eukaryota [Tanacetum cinerariifolium]
MVMSGSLRSKEDDVQKISTSVFVTNFPDGYGAKDLWNTCKLYGMSWMFLFLIKERKQNDVHSEDPFGFYEVLNKKRDGKNIDDKHKDSLKYPPGFTPNEEGDVPVEMFDNWSDTNRVNDGQKDGVWVDFNKHGAEAFHSFIVNASLVEVPLGGCSFTWCHKSAKKMSKLDRFLIYDNLMCSCPSISSTSLDRFLSDHRPIIMREAHYDYGSIPFKFFHYWFELDGFDKLHKESLNSRKSILKVELVDLDGVIDKGEGSDADGHQRREVVRLIQEVEKVDAMEVAQKANIKWSIE